MRIISYILILAIILLGVSFAMLNSNVVMINYFVGHRPIPLSMLLVLVFAIGSVLGVIIVGFLLVKVKMQNYHLRKQLKITEKEIENLRAIPLQITH